MERPKYSTKTQEELQNSVSGLQRISKGFGDRNTCCCSARYSKGDQTAARVSLAARADRQWQASRFGKKPVKFKQLFENS